MTTQGPLVSSFSRKYFASFPSLVSTALIDRIKGDKELSRQKALAIADGVEKELGSAKCAKHMAQNHLGNPVFVRRLWAL